MTETRKRSAISRFVLFLLGLYALLLVIFLVGRLTLRSDWFLLGLGANFTPYLFGLALIALLLAALLRAPRMAAIYGLLLLIGALWLAPRLLPPLRLPEARGTSLKLVTFNIYPHNQQVEEALEWLLSQNADLLMLQEHSGDFASLEAAYPYARVERSGGSGIFSRYPITEYEEITFGEFVHQRAVIEVAGSPFVLYNLHLSMPLTEDESVPLPLRYDSTQRDAQIREVLARAPEETLPVILVGDFNMSEYSPIYDQIRADYTDAYRAASWGIGATWPGGASEEWTAPLPRLIRLDYVWHTAGFQAQNATVGAPLGSDHLPLIVTLDWLP
ncbi:MAG: endonuclease/exonuclease/phosphatase family protein [Anaerolineae bacterium]|nr:endonuclease/exonuclease/phosphatase family protein [Anaerolineae bacterium]